MNNQNQVQIGTIVRILDPDAISIASWMENKLAKVKRKDGLLWVCNPMQGRRCIKRLDWFFLDQDVETGVIEVVL